MLQQKHGPTRSSMQFPSGADGPLGHRRGFVLVVVIWGVGLISLLALTVIRSADSYSRIAANDLLNAQTEALADAGFNLALFQLVNAHWTSVSPKLSFQINGVPLICRLDDAIAAIAIEDEGGKIDLNAAPTDLLNALLMSAGAEPQQALALAASIDAFRTAPRKGDDLENVSASANQENGLPYKHALFESTTELEQVPGITNGLFRVLAPFITVHSRQPGFDPSVAPPQLVAMLGGAALPAQDLAQSSSYSFLIRAEVLKANHANFVREAIVEFPLDMSRHIFIREWREGERRFDPALEGRSLPASLPPC